MTKYYKNKNNELFVDPILDNHTDLVELTEAEFNEQLAINNTPSQEDLDKQRIAELKQAREDALNALTHTFADGSIVQVRPKDIPNFQIAISLAQAEEWVMADDSVALLTVEQMTEAMNSGIVQGKAVWNQYTVDLKALNGD